MYRWMYCAGLAVALTIPSCNRSIIEEPTFRLSGSTMGTSYTISFLRPPQGIDTDSLQVDISETLVELNDQMSTYQSQSDLTRFNRSQTTEWVGVSLQLLTVLDTALRVSRLTAGAFDVTIGTLVNLWGFGPSISNTLVPSNEVIEDALRLTGYEHLHIRSDPPAIRKDIPGLYVDLSAIAKGYGVDQVAEYLESRGISNYLVEIGGELRSQGYRSRDIPWEIAIERPSPLVHATFRTIQLRDRAIATSGDYRNYVERNGRRFSHTIDPTTGEPITHRLASVTVLRSSAMEADALATAFMVLGPRMGYDIAVRENVAALFLVKHGEGFREKPTPEFNRYLKQM